MEALERKALVHSISKYVLKCIKAASDARTEADAATIAQLKQLRTELDRVKQQLSSNQKHTQSLERKLSSTGRTS
jgi:septal ring factor EnvC (AmiA/AmiB activator)